MAALTKKRDDDTTDAPERTDDPAGTDQVGPPAPPASEFTIKVADHQVDVDVKDAGDPGLPETTLGGIDDPGLQRAQKMLLDESARRANTSPRPFETVDTESLLVLMGKLRGELASR